MIDDAHPSGGLGAATPPLAIPLYLQVLWNGEDTSRPGPKRGVDLRAVGAAGVAIADMDGLTAVSMRRVAVELGFTTMALYRYVASKDELLLVMLNDAYGTPTALGPPGLGWRERLAAWAGLNRQILLAHPWILQVPLVEPPATPSQIGWMEVGLDALGATALTEQEKLSSLLLVEVFVRGQTQLAAQLAPTTPDAIDPGVIYAMRLGKLMDPATHPRVAAALGSGALEDDSDFGTDEFRFGLNAVLDGISALVDRRAEPSG